MFFCHELCHFKAFTLLSQIGVCLDLGIFCVKFFLPKLRLRKFFDKYHVCHHHHYVPTLMCAIGADQGYRISIKTLFNLCFCSEMPNFQKPPEVPLRCSLGFQAKGKIICKSQEVKVWWGTIDHWCPWPGVVYKHLCLHPLQFCKLPCSSKKTPSSVLQTCKLQLVI